MMASSSHREAHSLYSNLGYIPVSLDRSQLLLHSLITGSIFFEDYSSRLQFWKHFTRASFGQTEELLTHIFLCKIDEILQVDVVAVGFDVIVDEEVELVFDPVLEDEGKNASGQLQEEDQTQEHGKLGKQTCSNKQRICKYVASIRHSGRASKTLIKAPWAPETFELHGPALRQV